jgi:hypothetical protein
MRAALLLLLVSTSSVLAAPPTGKRTVHPHPTHVIVRQLDLDAQGAKATVAPGVGVVVSVKEKLKGTISATLISGVEITGRVDATALGLRVAADTEVFSEDGQSLGKARAGSFVIPAGTAGQRTIVSSVGPVHARVAIATAALTPEPRELVYPDPSGVVVAAGEPCDLFASAKLSGKARAKIDAGGRLVVVEELEKVVHVRTYGELELDGWVARPKVVELDKMLPPPGPPSRGLNPSHEALVDTPIYADGAGKKTIGVLRGGTLVTMGKDTSGDRVQVMTHGDVVIEAWVAKQDLRGVDGTSWSDGP